MKLKALIIDDELPSRANLEAIISNYFEDVDVIGQADNVNDAEMLITELQPDLLFLDIEMGSSTGLDLLAKIPNPNFEVIFITAYEEYAVKAFRTNATDYILKPIDISELKDALQKVKEKIKVKNIQEQISKAKEAQVVDSAFIRISTQDGMEMIPYKDIVYLKSINYYTSILLIHGREIVTSKILKEYEVQLKSANFFRIHNSYIINLRYLKGVVAKDAFFVKMTNDIKITISRRRKDEFLKYLQQNKNENTEF